MRVILLTHGGADLVIERIAELNDVEVVGVFIETSTEPKRSLPERFKRSLKYDGISATFSKIIRPATRTDPAMPDATRDAAAKAGIEVFEVETFHSASAIAKMRSLAPDLGIIYGTNIIKENVFGIPKLGSINFHQGLAPYYRGGPPIFWELFNDEKELGLTVHFVAAKVDTGDVVLQTTVPLVYDRSFGVDFESAIETLRKGLREECARLVSDAVAAIASGNFDRTPQDTSLGKRYRLPTKKEKDELRRRIARRLR